MTTRIGLRSLTGWRILRLLLAGFGLIGIVAVALWFSPRDALTDRMSAPFLTLIRATPKSSSPSGIVWSADSKRVAAFSYNGNNITIWDEAGKEVRELHHPGVLFLRQNGLGFLDHDRKIVTPRLSFTSEDVVLFAVSDIASEKIVREVPAPPGTWWGSPLVMALTSPDQSLVAAVSMNPGGIRSPVRLYDAESLELVTALDETGPRPLIDPYCAAFSPDSRFLAVGGGDGRVLIYDLAARKTIALIDAFKSRYQMPVMAIAVSPDGRFIAVSTGEAGSTWWYPDDTRAPLGKGEFRQLRVPDPVRVFRIADGKLVASKMEALDPVYFLSWGGRQDLIAFVSNGNQRLHLWNPWDPASPDKVAQLEWNAGPIAMSPDGSRIAIGAGGRFLLYRLNDKQ